MTKKEKRERKKQDRGIVDFMMVSNHFFHHFKEWILEMNDPRDSSYIIYSQADLGYMAILKNVCGQHTMREVDENFNQENIGELFWMERVCFTSKKSIVRTVFARQRKQMMEKQSNCIIIRFWKQKLC
ncbi:MAG: hypothetical protein PHX08_16460 [Lachnospiraceae bacterium]|nr:hypothetical protein [Lachnospiraceae bacterium]